MIFDFNKHFKYNLQVVGKYFEPNILPLEKKFNKIKVEDEEFNKIFRIYAEDDHEAFYLLTPTLIQRIKDITKNISSQIMFCFIDNKLHIAINNHNDAFEYDVFEEIDKEEIEQNILEDIKSITNLVDELNLDNDLFKEMK